MFNFNNYEFSCCCSWEERRQEHSRFTATTCPNCGQVVIGTIVPAEKGVDIERPDPAGKDIEI